MRRLLVLLPVLIAVTVVGVRVADPSLTESEVEVSLSDRPAVVAADSVRKLQQHDRTVEVRVAVEDDARGRQPERRIQVSIEPDERRYYTVARATDPDENAPPVAFFGTEGQGWIQQIHPDGEWGTAHSVRYPESGRIFEPAAIARADGRVVAENETTLVVRIEGADANAAVEGSYGYTSNELPGHLTVAIDKTDRRPRWAVRAYSPPDRNVTLRYRYRFEYGETSVERPEGVPRFNLREFLGDVYYG